MPYTNQNSSFDQGFSNAAPLPYPINVPVEVIFGTPGKNCLGNGICRLLLLESVRVRWKCPSARAWLSSTADGAILLSFDRDALPAGCFERYFRGHVFQVEEAYPLPKPLLSRLNIGGFTLASGLYSIIVSGQFYSIRF